ncbi:GAP family protein [Pseudoclavibacter helvolus]|uniref:Cytochrome c biogenesis protein CcdA n=1 Tax=Pseudoclavibacter helvolus TaxID=255205 RepID=A0A7W4YGP2_9MICO|nr:cytochrome c biogenesis protein CcdA [Pseudoclavibacter helvolus]
MSGGLVAALLGLAIVDSLNLSTIAVVILILLTVQRPVATGWVYAAGAVVAFFGLTMLVYFGASFAGTLVEDLATWMRRIIFVGFGVVFVVFGVRRFRTRERRGYPLLRWVNPITAFPLGMVATLADLPNAFPMFFAVERLIDANVPAPAALTALAGYTVVYAIPTVLALVLGIVFKDRPRDRFREVYDRLTGGEVRASRPMAGLHFAIAAACFVVAAFFV